MKSAEPERPTPNPTPTIATAIGSRYPSPKELAIDACKLWSLVFCGTIGLAFMIAFVQSAFFSALAVLDWIYTRMKPFRDKYIPYWF